MQLHTIWVLTDATLSSRRQVRCISTLQSTSPVMAFQECMSVCLTPPPSCLLSVFALDLALQRAHPIKLRDNMLLGILHIRQCFSQPNPYLGAGMSHAINRDIPPTLNILFVKRGMPNQLASYFWFVAFFVYIRTYIYSILQHPAGALSMHAFDCKHSVTCIRNQTAFVCFSHELHMLYGLAIRPVHICRVGGWPRNVHVESTNALP